MGRSCEPMDKNRIEGVAEQGERARNREAPVIKARRRKSGGCASNECGLTWGDLALWVFCAAVAKPKAMRQMPERSGRAG